MANLCSYKVVVKGKKNACYAFFGSMPCVDEKWIVRESGTDEAYSIQFTGDCKWAVDMYCSSWSGDSPVDLPDDVEDVLNIAEEYLNITVQDRSKMFEVEVWCNSADMDNSEYSIFEHYNNGVDVRGECPKELRFKHLEAIGKWEEDDYCDCDDTDRDLNKLYYASEEDNELKCFCICYKNPILEGVLEKYNYKSESIECVTNIDCFEEIIPNYVGVKTIENLTSTLISLYVSYGESDEGLEKELIARKNEIADGFSYIEGTSQESYGLLASDFSDGYDFELKTGEYKSKYRTCYGGW